jgi:hypothetical protein
MAHDDKLKDLANLVIPIVEKYCDKNNYKLIVKKIENFEKPPAWFKCLAILDEFKKNDCSYIFWLDIDTLILNLNFDLINLSKSSKKLYLSKDHNGINSGVMLIKNCDEMKLFFDQVYSLYPNFKNHGWWEQAAIIHVIQHNYLNIQSDIEYVPQKIFNAYDKKLIPTKPDGYVCSDTFILHLPSINNNIRKETIQKYKNQYYPN